MERSQRVNMLMGMLEKEPNDLFLNYALGLEYAKDIQTVHDAESQFRIVLGIDENYHAAYYQLGQLFESLKRTPEAIEFYKKGLACAEYRKDHKAANEFREAIF